MELQVFICSSVVGMDPDLKVAQCIAEVYQWEEEHPDEAKEVAFQFLEATDTSLNFKANGMIFQLIFPTALHQSDVVSEEIFIAINPDNSAPDSLLMALNEKLERVHLGPRVLVRVLDVLSKAIISFQGKKQRVHTKHVELRSNMTLESSKDQIQAIMHGDEGSEDGSDTDSNGHDFESNDAGTEQYLRLDPGDDDDCEHFARHDCGNEEIKRHLEKVVKDNVTRKRLREADHNKGYLYEVTKAARDRCEAAQRQSISSFPSSPGLPSFAGSSAASHMDDILRFCNVSTVPNVSLVLIQAEVCGIVNEAKLATALGLSFCKTIHMSLEFDKLFWLERNLRKPLELDRVTVKVDPSSRSSKVIAAIDASFVESSGKESDKEFEEEWKKFPGRQKTVAYGITVLLPELVHTFFRYRSKRSSENLRSKPWDNGPLDEALEYFATVENPFIGLICFLGTQLRALPSWCAICWSRLPASVWRLRTCHNDLCLYEFEELGLGATIHQEIQESPEVVQFELSLACAAATCKNRDVFEPFPAFFLSKDELRGRSGWFSNPSGQTSTRRTSQELSVPFPVDAARRTEKEMNKKLELLLNALQSIPRIADLKECVDENSLKRKLSKEAFALWKKRGWLESSEKWLTYDLMRFILSTNRLSLRVLKETEELKLSVKPKYQFVVLHDSPEKEAIFEEHKTRRGSFFAFHGSGPSNWYSILRNGLRSMSKTQYMSSGAAHGEGIYLADNFALSCRYARGTDAKPCSSWKNGDLADGMIVVAICEVVTGSANTKSGVLHSRDALGIYVVPPGKEDEVAVRYLMVIDSQSTLDFRSNVNINGSILEDRQFGCNSIDLQKHYEKSRHEERSQQQKILLGHRMEAFLRVQEDLACRQTDSEGGPIILPLLGSTESSCCASLKVKEQAGSPVFRPADYKSAGEHHDLLPLPLSERLKNNTGGTRASSTTAATQAITKEFRNVQNEIRKAKEERSSSGHHADSFLANITVDIPNETDLYIWHVHLHQNLFKSYSKLYKDLRDLAALRKEPESSVLLEVTFSGIYPFAPPFIRVIRPKFLFHTGHVTIGGSICMELLTDSGWLPSFSFENVLVQIVNAFVEGEGRIDKKAFGKEYSQQEAQEAFTRVANLHHWKVGGSKQ